MSESASYRVLSPVTESSNQKARLAPPIPDLSGKTFCAMRHTFRADETFPLIEKLLREQYGDIKFVSNMELPDMKPTTPAEEAELARVLKEKGCDVLLSGNGAWGTCAPAAARACIAAEKAGIPGVVIAVTDFVMGARLTGKAAGLPNLRVAVYPGAIAVHPWDEVEKNIREVVFPQIVKLLTEPVPEAPGAAAKPVAKPRAMVFEGSYEEINDFFYDKGWTDGSPIVPPTEEKVAAFLKYANRTPDDVLGTLHPALRQATVHSVAVNGVMAGCLPEHMPVLVALVEAIADPRFHLEDAGSSAGWSPLIILNGPVIQRLGFNAGTAVLRVGNRANTGVGRFLRLYMRNGAGFAPGVSDMATFGRPNFPVLAENEAASPWEPLSVARGYAPDESVVTVTSVGFMSFHLTVVAQTPDTILHNIAVKVRQNLLAGDGAIITKGPEMSPVLALSPVIARTLASAGYSRKDIQRAVFEQSRVPAHELDAYLGLQGIPNARECVKKGLLPAAFGESDDPQRLLPLYHTAEELQIVVAGTEERNRFFIVQNIARQGLATSKKIDMSALT